MRAVFGSWALIQRCRVHKLRNVVEHLPQHRRTWLGAKLHRIWSLSDADQAERQLRHLAKQLEQGYPSASRSLLEGLEETLTVTALGVAGALLRTLCSTNPIENVQGTLQRLARNVKRWRGGEMIERWVAVGLMQAEQKFRRVKGHRAMPQLIRSLDARLSNAVMDSQKKVA